MSVEKSLYHDRRPAFTRIRNRSVRAPQDGVAKQGLTLELMDNSVGADAFGIIEEGKEDVH